MDHLDTTQRKSFNPEAATFSPTSATTVTGNAFTVQESEVVGVPAAGDSALAGGVMATNQGPFISSLAALRLGHSQPMDMSAQHVGMREREAPQPQYLPDLDELTNSLGLAGAKPAATVGGPQQARLHNTLQRRLASTRGGKLLGRALDQPLTAVSLATYLKGNRSVLEETTTPTQDAQYTLTDEPSPQKIVSPPPGFTNQAPRAVTDETRVAQAPASHQQGLSGVPVNYFQHHDVQSTPHAASRRAQKQPRRYTRWQKRSDQGPLPSSADIYPDDSDWVLGGAPQQFHAQHNFNQGSPSARIQIGSAVSWPTLAEAYTPRDAATNVQNVSNTALFKQCLPMLQPRQVQQPIHQSQQLQQPPHQAQQQVHHDPYPIHHNVLNIQAHTPPTLTDYNALDPEVDTLLSELPRLSFNTMATFGALDPDSDNPQTTTTEQDIMRYGLTGTGIGANWLGSGEARESWENPRAFGVRPRDHEGWGGWEWAMRNGWGTE